jgi:hypothetical protein
VTTLLALVTVVAAERQFSVSTGHAGRSTTRGTAQHGPQVNGNPFMFWPLG